MEPLEIIERLKEKYLADIVDVTQFRDQVFVSVKRERITDLCRFLREEPDILMDYLADLCGVDYPEKRNRFEVIYNLYSMKHKHRLILKALVPGDDPSIDSVVPIWSGANWHEREACDMYGIVFNGHPDLRRILLPEDWDGYPLRKDYPLKGKEDWEFKGYEEAKDLHTHDDEWSVK